ncbi:MAG TPA: TIGR03546 family protein [Gemmatimonadaceae bacterium]
MLALLKLLQSLVRTLHSDGTPAQIAGGVALGAALGLTPLTAAHNLLVVLLLLVLNVSFGAGMLAWALFVPVGFLLDPVFDAIGRRLLDAPSLAGTWTAWFNTPVVPYTSFNNSVVLGSVVGWLLLFVPIFLLAHLFVVRYRATLGARIQRSRYFKAFAASKAYNVYRWFYPE